MAATEGGRVGMNEFVDHDVDLFDRESSSNELEEVSEMVAIEPCEARFKAEVPEMNPLMNATESKCIV